jgi:hypothetical protein
VIAMVEEQPFAAMESVTVWETLSADKIQRREQKKKRAGWKTSHDRTEITSTFPPIYLNRDSAGRVLLTTSTIYQSNDGLRERDTILCDPNAESVTWRIGSDTTIAPGSIVHGQTVGAPAVKSLPWFTRAFDAARWGTADNGWVVQDLGDREIDGVHAHGHRWWFGKGGPPGDGDFKELWVSEDLKMDLLYIEEQPTKGKGLRAELTHLRMKEPDPELFQMAKGLPTAVTKNTK